MKRISNKQSVINKRLAEIYNQLANEREHICSGCGRGDLPLSHSHIIPRSRRKDLECEVANITYHCLSINGRVGCHELWGSNIGDKQKLLDYHANMDYILEVDAEYFYLLTEWS
jgi:hypothetical protein